ncbi:rRNA-processing protein efg1 [Elasticomyces elasticus]|uniref:rRNA-processing protein EFG1 n=1 Tax=Exophiala sideris TaxID=1016849 RepID=A0ABR0J3B5_9EURO|nr:rRNA-processing protein efg1 [Elasticomyces elasticus]KAK5026538.1 rRNA-processing protein efg1 [Exophiala sideris]KAK5033721.1 rRNA-processing protein efg1 [Exophiala sideris]KAK5055544.1 rRNA-processing protein efg1 [Exophiala sideris]KAK5180073.1 rRNA-processing protein efg1 [Eurotiomycetes sp. CCFEE 6388]
MASYRPNYERDGSPRRRAGETRPRSSRHTPSDCQRSPRPERRAEVLAPERSAVVKTKKDRQTNPSTRIHSLRNLLAKDSKMPMTIRQEKERELAALLLDQQKAALAENGRKNLKRYHFVRFVERQKAQRMVKKLHKLRNERKDLDEAQRKELEEKIHEVEVDFAYTQYAPLGEKYLSIYVEENKEKGTSKPRMNPKSYSVLSDEQKGELRDFADELANVVRSAAGTKPPMWYEVEKYMAEGQEKLDALREGKLTSKKIDKDIAAVGGKDAAALRTLHNNAAATKPSWLADDGMIDPADLDSDNVDGGVQVDDEDISDGGFFER